MGSEAWLKYPRRSAAKSTLKTRQIRSEASTERYIPISYRKSRASPFGLLTLFGPVSRKCGPERSAIALKSCGKLIGETRVFSLFRRSGRTDTVMNASDHRQEAERTDHRAGSAQHLRRGDPRDPAFHLR